MVQATQPQGDIINGTPKEGHGQPVWQADAEGPNFTREEFRFDDGINWGVPRHNDQGPDHEPQGLLALRGVAQKGKQGDGAQGGAQPKEDQQGAAANAVG